MTNNIKNIEETIHSFSNGGYTRGEYLNELLNLQDEIVEMNFGHKATQSITLWNVVGKFNRLNKENGNTAEAECTRFYEDVSIIINKIKALKSGNRGEYLAFRSLETLLCENRIIKNVALHSGSHRTELDAVVITGKAVFIIEVKNSLRDIYIDDKGNYYRVDPDSLKFDKNIGQNMNDKAFLLDNALKSAGIYGVKIESVIVFTNSKIKVENNYKYIKTCFLSDLPNYIASYRGMKLYKQAEFDLMEAAIDKAECTDLFYAPVDMKAFKENYALLVSKIDAAMNNPKIQRSKRIRQFFSRFKCLVPEPSMATL